MEPVPDFDLSPGIVKVLLAEPADPLEAALVCVAAGAGGDAVRSGVLAAVGLGADVVDCEAFVVDRGGAAVSALIAPGAFYSGTPKPPSFAGCHGFEVKKVVGRGRP